MAALIRFFSKRRTRREHKHENVDGGGNNSHINYSKQSPVKKKNVLTCTIMLLDGTDITVDVSVSDSRAGRLR